ncbi:MAG TPA: HD domain-containing phosphohydrolase [Bacilli bacterium]|nr:HD domain-containing phosphohydrolase [Bacilli bacterium]
MLSNWNTWLEPYGVWIAAGAVAVVIVSVLALTLQQRARTKLRRQEEQAVRLLQHLHPTAGLENNLDFLLEVFGGLVEAHGYAFYVRRDNETKFVLRAVRYQESADDGKDKERYQPPISVPLDQAPQVIGVTTDGDVPLLNIPVGQVGLVRIGPCRGVGGQAKVLLHHLADLLPNVLDTLVETDRLKMQTDVVTTSDHALRAVCAMALDQEAVLTKTLAMFATALGFSGNLLFMQHGTKTEVLVRSGFSAEAERRLTASAAPARHLWNLIGHRDLLLMHNGDTNYAKVAAAIGNGTDDRSDLYLLSKIHTGSGTALLLSRLPHLADTGLTEAQLMTTAATLVKQLAHLIKTQNNLKPLSASYIDLLKSLSRTIDNLNPYTVGYSELMSRYSIIIAQEMGLPLREIQDISLAAYLSNIGVLGLSEDLYLKEGQFSEVEYEKMKLHAEVGAAIIELTIGNQAVAAYIRHHHERMDGNGYPAGLGGAEIPLGARIIAVVQTFLAKINGRKYREPLGFAQALNLLKSASGNQLDADVVNALIRWFEKKQQTVTRRGQSLGPCWEMCCSTAEICKSCPAYGQTERNCWEYERNNCLAHGKVCESCYVYTEAMARKAK